MDTDCIYLNYHFQPIYDTRISKITGVEILLRAEKAGKTMDTETFLKQAEKEDFVKMIDLWILERACSHMKELKQYGINLVHVNFAPKTLCTPGIEKEIKKILQKKNVSGNQICIEVTEKYANKKTLHKTLQNLRQNNLKIAMDDFEKSGSDMQRLFDTKFDIVKIDREYIKEMKLESRKRHLIKSLLQFFQSNHIKVVAEGIEDQETFELLKKWNCNYIQGYYTGRPMPYSDVTCFLQKMEHNTFL